MTPSHNNIDLTTQSRTGNEAVDSHCKFHLCCNAVFAEWPPAFELPRHAQWVLDLEIWLANPCDKYTRFQGNRRPGGCQQVLSSITINRRQGRRQRGRTGGNSPVCDRFPPIGEKLRLASVKIFAILEMLKAGYQGI
ncbi:hypothetical protein AVEN_251051-1 [Araneus ventricosus]|uniref:Uncharacterized protein n=1 Tax=Araneus ventricosus TaxID=182803 RepID=A0A4Y2DJZ2_ARAVE|nr:hypothetical protein AVEN_251051-1 [Araneus ventricosus]